jgi:hypothetical protein
MLGVYMLRARCHGIPGQTFKIFGFRRLIVNKIRLAFIFATSKSYLTDVGTVLSIESWS